MARSLLLSLTCLGLATACGSEFQEQEPGPSGADPRDPWSVGFSGGAVPGGGPPAQAPGPQPPASQPPAGQPPASPPPASQPPGSGSGAAGGGLPLPDVSDVDPTRDPSCGASWVAAVRGRLVGDSGEPLVGAKAQLCLRTPEGQLNCLRPADTDETGGFRAVIPAETRCMESLALRVLVPGAQRATVYCQVDVPAPGVDAGIVSLPTDLLLPATVPAQAPPGGGAVRFDGGLEIDVSPDQIYFQGGDYTQLAARSVPPASPGLCMTDGQLFDGLVAFSPEADVEAEAGFPLRLPNSAGLPPGAQVDLFVLGGLDCRVGGELVHEGDWGYFGTATVSPDGQILASDAASGVPCLTWLAWKHR